MAFDYKDLKESLLSQGIFFEIFLQIRMQYQETKEEAVSRAGNRELWRCNVHEGTNVQKCKPQTAKSHAMRLRPKHKQLIRF